ncbi:MAG: hypothetical protein NPIRA04_14140 [Nitrospirales bacterium]|nr:MAG: hypothetical protein NPIRA04_14140 [Nitrospirales bacterium]
MTMMIGEAVSVELTDLEVAEQIQTQLNNNPDVESVVVKGHLLQLSITESLYNRLAIDRERGRKIVLTLMQSMKRLTNATDVTVWVYCGKEKMIEGKVKDWGGDNVNYLYDL